MSPACFLPTARSFAYYWGYFFAWLHWMREAVIRVHPWLPLRCCCLLVTGRLATDQHACLSREHAALTILPCSLPPALPTPPFFYSPSVTLFSTIDGWVPLLLFSLCVVVVACSGGWPCLYVPRSIPCCCPSLNPWCQGVPRAAACDRWWWRGFHHCRTGVLVVCVWVAPASLCSGAILCQHMECVHSGVHWLLLHAALFCLPHGYGLIGGACRRLVGLHWSGGGYPRATICWQKSCLQVWLLVGAQENFF